LNDHLYKFFLLALSPSFSFLFICMLILRWSNNIISYPRVHTKHLSMKEKCHSVKTKYLSYMKKSKC
jgi:hypothetical protein